MKKTRLWKVFKSRYCILAFLIALVISYFLVPAKIFYGYYSILALIFILVFSLNLTCLIRSVKDRIVEHKKQKNNSPWGLIFGLIGLSALQTCTVGAPICGVSIGMAVVSSVFPAVAFDFISDYSLILIGLSIIIQVIALQQMKCFKAVRECGEDRKDLP